jgi:hypothetical protein
MKWLLLAICAFIDPQMSSKKASFDGKCCVLEDDVILDHPFGRLKTDKAILEKGDSEKISFEKAWLENHVEVFLNSGAVLKGSKAYVDLGAKNLTFSGNIQYQEAGEVTITAQHAESEFEEKEAKFLAQSVLVKTQVKAVFETGRVVTCDQAHYKPQVFFSIRGEESVPCHLVDHDLDLKTSSGDFDLIKQEGKMLDVNATLLLPISGVKSKMKLQAEEIKYSEATQIIESCKSTYMESEAYSLKSDLKKLRVKLGANKQVEEALLDGLIQIKGPEGQTLECTGIVKLHEGKQQLVLKSHPDHFIVLKTDDLVIKSTKARLFYKQQGNKFIPLKLELEDQVQLFDQRQDRKVYGKAFQAHVFLEENRVQLYGDDKHRVLYVDESLDMNLSAPEVLVQKNDEGKLSVQGVGAVRFSFNDEEKKLIEKIKKLAHE